MSAALAPAEALARAVRLLEAEGFTVVARNARGDSLYCAPAGATATVRVSNHARRPRQRRTHPEVATSLVIRGPRSAAQVESQVAAALREFSSRTAGRSAGADGRAGGSDRRE